MFTPKDLIKVGEAEYALTEKPNGTYKIELANEIEQYGNDINAALLASTIGFESKDTSFNEDGSITETDGTNTKTTTFNADGSISEELTDGENTITKTTTFNDDGSISEVIQII